MSSPKEEMIYRSKIQISDIEKWGEFVLVFTGEPIETYWGKQSCVWFSANYGSYREKPSDYASEEEHQRWLEDGGWAEVVLLYNTEKDVQVVVDHNGETQQMLVSWRRLRPHISPSFLREYEGVPESLPFLEAWFSRHSEPVTMAEFCLHPDRRYHARVETETYHLPPSGPDAEPEVGVNHVLVISDEPFLGSSLSKAAIPLFLNWMY